MSGTTADLVSLDVERPVWDQFFSVAPMVIVGTIEADGRPDFAPKHMATPLGLENYFGFVCTPSHATYSNAKRTGVFTVSFPPPDQLLFASLAASPRDADSGEKSVLGAFGTLPASSVEGFLLDGCMVHLECELFKVVDGFDRFSLIAGRVIAASAHRDAVRATDLDDRDLLARSPQLVYLHPNRFASVDQTHAFPIPRGMKK